MGPLRDGTLPNVLAKGAIFGARRSALLCDNAWSETGIPLDPAALFSIALVDLSPPVVVFPACDAAVF
jgi:hypothetical protein